MINRTKKKVIIIEHEPLTVRLKEAWMIENLINKGIDLEYWDLSKFTDKNLSYPNQVKAGYIRYVNSFEEFKSLLRNLAISDYIFFIEIQEGWCNFKLFRELKRFKCRCMKYELYASISYPQRNLLIKRIKLLFTKTGFYFKTFILFNKITKFFQYDEVFSPCSYRNRTIAVNHPDFEKFRSSKSYKDGGYFVFLDVFYPLHPDYIMYDGKEKNPYPYWNVMNHLFHAIETKFGKEVIIAAHPKSDYRQDTFCGRKIIKNETCELVKGCDGVILHNSASINYAILANKPLLMGFTKEQLEDETMRQSADALSRFIDAKVFSFDNIQDSQIEFTPVANELRNRFIDNMLASEDSRGRTNVDIFFNYIINQSK